MKIKAVIYPAFVILVGLPLGVFQVLGYGFQDRLIEFLILLAFVVLIEVFEVSLFGNWFVSVSSAIYLASVYVGGPSLGVSLAALSMILSEPFNRRKYFREKKYAEGALKALFQVSQLSISVWVAAFVFGASGAVFPPETPLDWMMVFLAFLSYTVTNNAFVAFAVFFENGTSFVKIVRDYSSNALFGVLPMGAMSVVIAFLFELNAAALIFMMIFLVYYMISFLKDSISKNKKISDIDLLMNPVNLTEKSREDLKHMQSGCVDVAKSLGLDASSIESVREASKFRSIGAFLFDDEKIESRGPLGSDTEQRLNLLHEKSATILKNTDYADTANIIFGLCDRFDGKGVIGKAGDEIPIESRIILGCLYDSILDDIKPLSGNILDPSVVEAITNLSPQN